MTDLAAETREDRLKWLLRPLNWASTVCCYGALMSGMMWFDSNVSVETIAIVATGALFITFGLLFWVTVRTTRSARGQY
jgi:hypothetical protein